MLNSDVDNLCVCVLFLSPRPLPSHFSSLPITNYCNFLPWLWVPYKMSFLWHIWVDSKPPFSVLHITSQASFERPTQWAYYGVIWGKLLIISFRKLWKRYLLPQSDNIPQWYITVPMGIVNWKRNFHDFPWITYTPSPCHQINFGNKGKIYTKG